MIKYVVQIRDNYNYRILQMDLDMVVHNNKAHYIVDRATYDAHAAANRASGGGYYGNKLWKIPTCFRGRSSTINPSIVFDTREDAAAAALKLVEDKVREDIIKKQKQVQSLEDDIRNLSGKQLNPIGKFENFSTIALKKRGKNKP